MKRIPLESILRTTIVICIMLLQLNAYAQENKADTTKQKNRNIFQGVMNAFSRNPKDSSKQAAVLSAKSETPFLLYNGKIIRHITVEHFGFERNFSDTTKKIQYFGTKVLNSLHRDTREWVIRDNLFIRENTELNPYIVADNERYLRSLEFIRDTRIIVEEINNEPDSVDLLVITKDLFSITAELKNLTNNRLKVKVGDVNVAGMGQSIFFTSLIQKNRYPAFGYEVAYTKNSVANTFINASATYSTIGPDLARGSQDETAWSVQLNRPLVSQYSRFAGSLLIGSNRSKNNYHFPDSIFYKYHYNTFDAWIGYNLNIHKLLLDRVEDKMFIGIRYFRNNFVETPYQTLAHYNFRYDDKQAALASITFFRQKFYKTNYIYGFGTTEDMPYGYNVAVTAGLYKQADLKRPYAGIDANKYVYTNSGFFIQYFLRTGAFLNSGEIQDANFLIGSSMYSKLFLSHNVKWRQYFNLSYAKQFNRKALDPLDLNNFFGIRYFRTDSLFGDERLSLYSETFLFLNGRLFGFKFSPFAFGNISLLTPEEQAISKAKAYYSLGGGVRTRNENFVFGTIELRFAYFPASTGQNSFKIKLTGNIRFKYNSNYVKAPEIVQVNNNNDNVIY